jgi:N-methylhydantoinase A
MQLDNSGRKQISAIFWSMEQEARANLHSEGVAEAQIEINHALGMRYLGQSWELVVDLPNAPNGAGASTVAGKAIAPVERILAAFADVHDRRFGHRSGGAVEIVSFRLAAVGRVAKPRLPLLQPAAPRPDARIAMRDIRFGARFDSCAVYARDRLVLDEVVAGPAVIEESGSTTIVPLGWTARTMAHGELLMERSGHG